jgi:hypothetical protein
MGACLALIGGLILANFGTTDLMGNSKNPWSLYNKGRAHQDLPPLAGRDESQEKSFAGQIHTDVRAPDHYNPYEHYINDFQMLQNEVYAKRYQRNIYTLWSQEPEWKLDPYFNSSLNNFNNYTSSESPWDELSKFQEKRRDCQNQWQQSQRVG